MKQAVVTIKYEEENSMQSSSIWARRMPTSSPR